MTAAPTPGWTGHIAVDSALVMLDRIDCSPDDDARIDAITATLRQLHAAYQALQTENERLQMELVAEARAAAEQKLRADQLAQQHRMQAQMHAQATQQLAELEARKPLPLSDEQIDAIADGMPGGLGGFMKTWGWRQFARKILELRAPPTWEPQFDFMAPGQEDLAMQFCLEIAGLRGQKGSPPDPVRLMEMAQALYKAEAGAALVDKSPDMQEPQVDKTANLQDRQRFWGFFHSTCIYESDAELISLHATKAGAWRAMHRAQWLAWEEVRTLQMAGRREPGWKAYVHEASHIGLVEVQP